MKIRIIKCLLVFCFALISYNAYSQHRYYCEVKGIEKELSSGLKSSSILVLKPHTIYGVTSAAN